MKVYLHSIGCRLNQSEVESIGRQLLAAGHEIVAEVAVADKVVINTCAVTAAAARDARSTSRRIHRLNGDAEIILTGCYATVAPTELSNLAGVGRVVANPEKDRIVAMIDPRADAARPTFEREPILREYLAGLASRTRAFVKVQDGCDNRCTFCITTVARGPGRSRPMEAVVAEIQELAGAGYQEAVLTGVHLGSYGRDRYHASSKKAGLAELIKAILTDTDIPRLRISSLEPWDIASDFFALWQTERLLPHLHMPLQSGSDKILRRMGRKTSRSRYRKLAGEARAHIADLNLSTDVIVGFPGETASDFAETLEYLRQIGFSRLHVFGYCERPGTAAARMPQKVSAREKKDRVRRVIALGQELSLAFHRKYEGRVQNVLWEANTGANARGLRWLGYTGNYIRVDAFGEVDLFNRVTRVRLCDARPDGMSAQPVSHPSPNGVSPEGGQIAGD